MAKKPDPTPGDKPLMTQTQIQQTERRKSDLHKALNSLSSANTEVQIVAKHRHERAKAAFEAFCKTNKEYLKVFAEKEEAEHEYYRVERREKKNVQSKVSKLRNRLYVEGPTDALVADIAKLAEELAPDDDR